MTAASIEPPKGARLGSIALSELALPAVIPEFRHRASEFARNHGAEQAIVEGISLAVSEAVTNVVRHAHNLGESGVVELKASVGDGLIEILVSDEGHGFRETDSGGLGLGLSFIAEVSADLEISQGAGGTRVRMRFPLPR